MSRAGRKAWVMASILLFALITFPLTVRAEEPQPGEGVYVNGIYYGTEFGHGPVKVYVDLNEWYYETVTGSFSGGYSNGKTEYVFERTEGKPTERFLFDGTVGHYVASTPKYTIINPVGDENKYVVTYSVGTPWLAYDKGTYYDMIGSIRVAFTDYVKEVGAPDDAYRPVGGQDDYWDQEPYDRDYFACSDGMLTYSTDYVWKAGDYRICYSLSVGNEELYDQFTFILLNHVCDFHIDKASQLGADPKENLADENGNWTPKADPDCTTVKAVLQNPYPEVEMSVLGIKRLAAYGEQFTLEDYLILPHGTAIDPEKTVNATTNREGYEVSATFDEIDRGRHPVRYTSYAPYVVWDKYHLTVSHAAFGTDEPQICYLYVDGGQNYEDKVLAVVTYANEMKQYNFWGYLGKDYDGEPVSVTLNVSLTPYTGHESVKWYYVTEEGQRGEEVEGTGTVTDENGNARAYGPSEVGEYQLAVFVDEDMEVLSIPFTISEYVPPMPVGKHSYALTGSLDKFYDGMPVSFEPDEMIMVDKGYPSWSELEESGEVRYVWRNAYAPADPGFGGKDSGYGGKEPAYGDKGIGYAEKGKGDPIFVIIDDLPEPPVNPGNYFLVIQEYEMKGGWTDVQIFGFSITLLQDENLQISKKSLTLCDAIALNFKMERSVIEGKYVNPCLLVMHNDKIEILTDHEVSEDGTLLIFNLRLAPYALGDVMTVIPRATDEEGHYVYGVQVAYSAAEYCYNMLRKEEWQDDVNLRKLLVDLLRYGDAAQIYVGWKTDQLVSADLTDEEKACGTDLEVPMVYNSVKDKQRGTVSDEVKKASMEAASLFLEGRVNVVFKFTADAADLDDLKVAVADAEGTILGSYAANAKQVDEKGRYFIYFDGLNAGELRKTLDATVMLGDQKVSNTFRYSVESYAASMKGKGTPNLDNLLDAMMRYGDSAAVYAGY